MIVLDLSKERPDTGGVGAGDECRKVSTRALPGSHRIREKVLKQRSTLTVLVAGSGAAMIKGWWWWWWWGAPRHSPTSKPYGALITRALYLGGTQGWASSHECDII